jgi:hypothetical protein
VCVCVCFALLRPLTLTLSPLQWDRDTVPIELSKLISYLERRVFRGFDFSQAPGSCCNMSSLDVVHSEPLVLKAPVDFALHNRSHITHIFSELEPGFNPVVRSLVCGVCTCMSVS